MGPIIIALPFVAVFSLVSGVSVWLEDKNLHVAKYHFIVSFGLIFAYILFGFATFDMETMLELSKTEGLACGGMILVFFPLLLCAN